MTTFGINEYYYKHNTPESGNSYFVGRPKHLIEWIQGEYWNKRIPGDGEDGVDRKVLVPIEASAGAREVFLCPT